MPKFASTSRGIALLLISLSFACSGKGCGSAKPPGSPEGTPSGPQGATAAGGSENAPAGTGEVSAQGTPESLAQVMREIETLQATLPRDRVDPAAVLTVAREPAKIVAWVRENTRAIAYEGSLRGPLGVLMDRSGNSLDRALLVRRLLTLAGHEARVVGGRLSPEDALRVPPGGSLAGERATTPGDERKEAAAIATMILAKAGPLTLTAPAAESTHYWAQFNDGKAWVDADPTGSALGQARTRAEGPPIAIDPQTHGVAHTGSSQLLHSVTMRMVVERWEAGRLAESQLGELPFDSSTEPLSALSLTFAPVDPSTHKAMARAFTTGAELREQVLGETAWAVVAGGFGSPTKMGRMFDDAGVVGDAPKSFERPGVLGGAAKTGLGGMMDAFGGGEPEKPSVLTALIADYEIAVPGTAVRRVRRFLFDSIGPEARAASGQTIPRPAWSDQQRVERGARLAGLHDSLVTFASLPPEVYAYRFSQRLIDAKDAVLAVVAGSKDDSVLERASYALSLRTLELFAAVRHLSMDPRLAVVEPQIVRREIRYVLDQSATMRLDTRVLGDLTWNRLAPADGSVRPVELVTQGVLDTLQESAIVLRDARPLPGQTTAALFEESARQGVDSVAVRTVSDAVLMGFPGETRGRMARDVQDGQVLVAPRKPVVVDGQPRLGWWRVDPNTGQAVGAMDTGLLQALVGYTIPLVPGGSLVLYHVAASPQAMAWANHMSRMRGTLGGSTSRNQWALLVKYAQGLLDAGKFLEW